MTDIEKLIAIEDIRRLKAVYFRCMDLKLWDELAALFTEDAIFDVRGALDPPRPEEELADQPVIRGREAISDYVRTGLTPLVSVHHGHMPEIEIISNDMATGIWAMTDALHAPEGAPFRTFRGYGHYRETYARADGCWRIATLQLRRLRVEMD